MDKYYALINNNLVVSVSFCSEDFVDTLKTEYDYVIDVTDDRPTIGDSYYPDTDEFIINTISINYLPVTDPDADYLHQGIQDGFDPFSLSKYSVSYSNGMVTIGCKQYSAPGLMEVLHKLLVSKDTTVGIFSVNPDGNPGHGKFDVTWDDVLLLHDTLIRVKLL